MTPEELADFVLNPRVRFISPGLAPTQAKCFAHLSTTTSEPSRPTDLQYTPQVDCMQMPHFLPHVISDGDTEPTFPSSQPTACSSFARGRRTSLMGSRSPILPMNEGHSNRVGSEAKGLKQPILMVGGI